MSEQDEQLGTLLRAFRKRITLLVTERMVCWGVAIAGVLAMLLVFFHKYTEWYITVTDLGMILLLLAVIALGVIGGLWYMRRRPISDLSVALTVERRINMKQRVSTAITMGTDEGPDGEFRQLIAADAVANAPTSTPRDIFPRKFSRHHKVVIASWAVVLVLWFLPLLPWFYSKADLQDRAQMQETGATLKKLAQEMKKQPGMTKNQIARQLLRNMKKLGAEMEKNRMQKKTALVRMNKLEEQLAKIEKELQRQEQEQAKKAMTQAAAEVQKAMENRSQEEKAAAERAKKKLASGMPQQKLTKEEKQALEKEKQLDKLAKQLQQGNTDAASQTLSSMGKNMQSLNLSAAQLKQLAAALQKANAAKGGKMSGKMAGALASSKIQLGDARNLLAGMMRPMGRGRGRGRGRGNGRGQGWGDPAPGGGQGGGHLNGNVNKNRKAFEHKGDIFNPKAGDNSVADDQSLSIDIKGAPEQHTDTHVPYYEVYPDYRNQAEHAVEAENVPPTERQRVKSYFKALDPSAE